jgi:hypothetical protein
LLIAVIQYNDLLFIGSRAVSQANGREAGRWLVTWIFNMPVLVAKGQTGCPGGEEEAVRCYSVLSVEARGAACTSDGSKIGGGALHAGGRR